MTPENKNFADCTEIPADLLDQIAGGMSEGAESALWQAMTMLKANGRSKDDVLAIYVLIKDPVLREEALAYTEENWDRA